MSTADGKATPGWAEDGRVMATVGGLVGDGADRAAPMGPMMPVPAHW